MSGKATIIPAAAGAPGSASAPSTGEPEARGICPPGDRFAPAASVAAEGITVEVDTAGAIDVTAERRRTEKDLAAARKEAEQTERKLGNEAFLSRAPAGVVTSTRERLAAAQADIARLTARLAALAQGDA